ncbi:MAG: nitroreductase/quinone reductase family protein [Actinomycetes bacterium]
MQTPNKVIEVGAWMLENGHRVLLKVSGGRFPRNVLGMTPVELRTLGRKSGEWRATLLTAPVCEPDRVVVVASKGGHQDHPQWYKNLAVNPEVELTVDGTTRPMRARTAAPDEKAALWPRITAAYKGYEGYQRNTTREIPVVICEPR